MSRETLGDGRWFDTESAEAWGEDSHWDGNNFVSTATGSQWDHETLYLTKSGTWVLHFYSQMQGTEDTYRSIDSSEAAAWLSVAGEEPVMKDPTMGQEKALKRATEAFEKLAI